MKDNISASPEKSPKQKKNVSILSNDINEVNPDDFLPANLLSDSNLNI